MKNERTLYLIRGLPGSGKSTYAKKLVKPEHHFEADQYFMIDGRYQFNPTKLHAAHADCFDRVRTAMLAGDTDSVAVSNTFVKAWELEPHIKLAQNLGWKTKILRMSNKYGSVHGVPLAAIERMRANFEPVNGEIIL